MTLVYERKYGNEGHDGMKPGSGMARHDGKEDLVE
jgi:hypothetical protein